MAMRNDETPQVKLTVVIMASMVQSVMKAVGQRMETFAQLMGVPLEINVENGSTNLEELIKDGLGIQDDKIVAFNCMGTLTRVDVDQRESIPRTFRLSEPHVMTVRRGGSQILVHKGGFCPALRGVPQVLQLVLRHTREELPNDNERLMLERECSWNIIKALACKDFGGSREGCKKWERGVQWSDRLSKGLSPVRFSDDAVDDMKALLKRYRTGWLFVVPQGGEDRWESGLHLSWKDEPLLWASAWKP